jgi:hypothetical protein
MPAWKYPWEKEEEVKKEEKHELPPELEARFKKVDELDTKVSSIDTKLAALDSITAFIEDSKKEKEDARKAAETARNRKTPEEIEDADKDMAALLLSDPKAAFGELSKPLQQVMLMTRADNIKREVFTDRAEEFPYYSGEVKNEVDKILGEQTLQFRNDPNAVANVYHTVVGKRMKDINEGKIKSRFAGGSGPLSNTNVNKEDELTIELSDDIKRMAKLTGMSEADAKTLVEKAAKAGEIDYV